MALITGTRLGPYEIVSAIGAGGMGEVYKARDTRLERTVAIKVLPAEWANHPDMTERFAREAQVIASLNHPNICALHDVQLRPPTGVSPSPAERAPGDIDFLVMEFLEGETLADRLKRGPLALDDALGVAIAIADALDKAHRQRVVHRDLKPGNIMLTAAGPKLLDFGLARIVGTPAADPSATRTTPPPITKAGMILGTLQYMAPEQLEGLDADARTDIFAFGVVLYEMITGRRAFDGKSQVLLMSAIATAEPQPLSKVQPAIPPALDHVVRSCLAKEPDERWQTARDLLAELRWIAEGGAAAGVVEAEGEGGRRRSSWLMLAGLAGAAVAILAMAIPAFLYLRGPADPDRLEFRVPLNPLLYNGNAAGFFAVSPDGRRIAIRARSDTAEQYYLYVGPLGFLTPQRLAGTEGAAQPFWSADSREIAFVADGKMKRIDAAGGPAHPICEVTQFAGGTWNAEGTIVFGSATGLFRVPAEGGKPVALTTIAGSETGHFWPRFLPDGRRFLYLVWSEQTSERAVVAGSLDAKDKTRIMAAESNVVYSSAGYLLFRRETSVYAQPFNTGTLSLSGTATRVADDLPASTVNIRGAFDLSADGVLAFYRDKSVATATVTEGDTREWQLAWVNRTGQEPKTVGKPGIYRGVDVSPNGTRVAVHRHDAKGGDIWVFEPGGTETRITFDASHDNSMPIWSPGGDRIAFASLRKGKWGLYQVASDGSGREELLVESDLPKAPMSWSPDGLRLVYWVRDPKTSGDLWVLPFDSARKPEKPSPLIATEANERHAQISPDGKWIAYAASPGGRPEVYVQPFPSGSGRWQISPDASGGADWPRWKRAGQELLYHRSSSPSVFISALVSVPWNAAAAVFTHDPPRELTRAYAIDVDHSGGEYHTYAVSPDGQRLLIFQAVADSSSTTGQATEPDPLFGVTVVLNWTSALKK